MAKQKPAGVKPVKAAAEATALFAGNYANSLWFEVFADLLETQYPGSKAVIEAAALVLPWAKLAAAVTTALADYGEGKDFLTILQDVLLQWVTISPAGKMMAKA